MLFVAPWYVQGDAGPMAPAVIITFFEAFSGGQPNAWMRAGLPLMGMMALGYLLLALFLWWQGTRVVAEQPDAEDA